MPVQSQAFPGVSRYTTEKNMNTWWLEIKKFCPHCNR